MGSILHAADPRYRNESDPRASSQRVRLLALPFISCDDARPNGCYTRVDFEQRWGDGMHHPGETVENVLNLGSILAGPDAERAAKMAQSAAPFSHLIVDFSRVRECDDAAFLYLIHALKQLVELDLTVDLHGMTHDQRRLLKDLGHRTEASTGVA